MNVAEGSNQGDLVAQVRKQDEPIVAEAGMTVSYGGQFEAQQSASRTIFVAGIVVAVVMLLLLLISTGSMRAAVLVMLNMPLALIGGIVAIYLTEGGGAVANTLALVGLGDGDYIPPVISIASMVGFITLTGISARNGIMMLSHYLHLMQHEGEHFERKMILRGTQERLVPVLMTALTAMLALTPLVIAAGEPGKEILHPVAVVIFAGLFTSTALDLIVTPLIFYRFARRSVARLVPEAVEESSQS